MNFRRYLAEAISTLDFKTQEEPMMIISLLNSALAVCGLQILHLLETDLEGGKGLMNGIKSSPSKIDQTGAFVALSAVILLPLYFTMIS